MAEWLDKLQDGEKRPSESTFRRAIAELAGAGLIVSETHFWQGKRSLWIKPSPDLTRILFEPGRWEAVRDSYTTQPKPKAPRGNSAAHARYMAEAKGWYRRARGYDLPGGMSDAERWTIFRRLTEPQEVAKSFIIQPFAPAGSHKHRVLRDTLLP
ncbi:hypothetical protein [Pseudogemmobacter sonorensis]|uniref:hypothetical protein n=1 Tax=Pseudogemmobacter sonorensis TaxID=2989681 RepID=UPI0036C9757E